MYWELRFIEIGEIGY
jgi:hypothetical protein